MRMHSRRTAVLELDPRGIGEAERPDRELRRDHALQQPGERSGVGTAHAEDGDVLAGHHAQGHLGDEAGDALGAGHEVEVVALDEPHLSGWQHEPRRDHVFAEPSVAERAVAGAPLREPAPDRGRRVRARIQAQSEPAAVELAVKPLPDDAGLDRGRHGCGVDPDHAGHPAHIDDQAAVDRHDPAVAGGCLRARRERHSLRDRPADECDELGLGFRLHDRIGYRVAGERSQTLWQDANVVSVQPPLRRIEGRALAEHRVELGASHCR
jgi:hypothetical protein